MRAVVLSFRLGGTDGVSVETAKWGWALGQLGFEVRSVAGSGTADVILPGLAWPSVEAAAPTAAEVAAAIGDADLVVVENVLSLPLNPAASTVVAHALKGRSAIVRHHDLPWQRAGFDDYQVPDDPAWRHVTINRLSVAQLAERDIDATCVYNHFDVDPPAAEPPERYRRLVLHPVRAIRRKNIPAALALAKALDATYWLLGPAEEGYGDELARLFAAARVPVIHRPADPADAYTRCDVVAFPSTWEGFGNPLIESAVFRKPLFIGDGFPVATELEKAFGFRWAHSVDQLGTDWLDHNHQVARRHFNLNDLPAKIKAVLP